MKKYLFAVVLAIFISVSSGSGQIVQAVIIAPSFSVTINEHAVDGDGTFNFHIAAVQNNSGITDFTADPSISTVNGEGAYSTNSPASTGYIYYITQDVQTGWSVPSIVCSSPNPNVVSTPTSDGGVAITADSFSFVSCDVTNTKTQQLASNVIFVPGFEGSRLYEKKNNGSLIQRWEAGILSFTDIKSLFLDNSGKSVKNNIVTKDVIERTNYPLGRLNQNLYQSVANLFRLAKTNQTIQDFLMFPYDWRMDVDNLALNGSKTDTGVLKLKDKIVELANTSKTGKVTLVGHSNGGLLIKRTIAILKDSGQSNLVDKIILVASPQLGTPSTLSSMLHGDNTALGLLDSILTAEDARELSKNMPGAYGLLPSEKLYQKMGSFVDFDSSLINNWTTLYGSTLDFAEQANFLSGGDNRKQPAKDQLYIPQILQKPLLDTATSIHNQIDNLNIPSNISTYEIAGVGVPTVQGIKYTNSIFALSLQPRTLKLSCDGDKTVVSESAIDYSFHPVYINLFSYKNDTGAQSVHFNIMENPEVLDILSNIALGTNKNTPHITDTKPDLSDCKFKVIGMHSPADLDVYDSLGRHVGINKTQSTDSFTVFDTNIPGSDFFTVGDEKYAIVPDTADYTVKIDGTGNGIFTLDVRTQTDSQTIDYQSYANLPVSPSLKGEVVIPAVGVSNPLRIDANGDGVFEETVAPNTDTNPLVYLEALRTAILNLELKQKTEKAVLAKIDNVVKLIKKGKLEKASQKMQNFLKRVEFGKWANKQITQSEKDDLIIKINTFLDSI